MLAAANQPASLDGPLESGLEVLLPESLRSFFAESGYMPTTAAEYRGNARLRVRTIGELSITHTPPILHEISQARGTQHGKVLVKDLSRSGIGILYHQQLFPAEEFFINFHGRHLRAQVVRCRRIDAKCFEIGARILSLTELAEEV